ncbi:hypothetical protein HanRHA438_Chr03g0100941 [Helianthus annuus]|uniref:Uncharacterized protein n=1 Tax=Helianthus annuus TaxID=4232 RepID=A0A251V3L7_HELAN|nr:hypothetical protein HanIR_Chr12g0614001 [Helianthus annuus]KAJ0591635.1 hypothetical protein HanHA300_Chr03g0075491 [Helianthus annuus]KAJ0606529.1 hypothetical protein HanHA89_Chr03g0086141 [Helianthus annuus]KAJ0772520.1 hypothetical protein HanOQP8_Chr03g0088251 [Helianthus annuus]KAJ0933864.1 hypothetical protein HanRHA438_Chr03g0100941 [Helianthus annuus]
MICAFLLLSCWLIITFLQGLNITSFCFILSMLAVLAQELRLYKFLVLDANKGFSPFQVDCTEIVYDQPSEKFNPNDGDGLHLIFTKRSYELFAYSGI